MATRLLPARFGPALTLVLAGLLPAGGTLAAQQPFEVSVAGGFHMFDSQLDLASGVGLAGRLGLRVVGPLELEAEASYTRPRTDTPLRERVGTTTFGGWVLLNHELGRTASVFVKGGYASVNFGSCPVVSIVGSGPCGSAGVIQGGVGGRFAFTPMVQLRYDALINRSLTDLKFSNVTLQAGVALMLGGRRETPQSRPAANKPSAPVQPAAPPLTQAPVPAPAPTQAPAQTPPAKDTVRAPAPAPAPAQPLPQAQVQPQPQPQAQPPAQPVPSAAPPAAKTDWVLPGTVWPYRAAVLSADAFPALDSIARILKADPTAKLEIKAYAYDRLIPADDAKLSQFRADAVRSYLTFKGVSVSRITATGKGSQPLIDKGGTEEARTANRRVEIRILRPPQ